LVNLAVFFFFGLFSVRDSPQFHLTFWLYALLSLTLIRMLPVAIALIGTGLDPASTVFMGWFGPRGLASIVLRLVYLKQKLSLPGESTIRLAVIVTVLLSIFVHGLSTSMGIDLYARRLSSLTAPAPEHQQAN
jgi:NhaP-type Na+/H+ or K+/H+ antiporter